MDQKLSVGSVQVELPPRHIRFPLCINSLIFGEICRQNVVQGASGDVYGLHILRCDPWIPEHKASNKYQEAHELFVVLV